MLSRAKSGGAFRQLSQTARKMSDNATAHPTYGSVLLVDMHFKIGNILTRLSLTALSKGVKPS
ncbi:MAG: hypothetical protein KAT04_11340 [Methylococcales bacterium]|nr:hypothetical protein [Methylococcales bacterium]